MPQRRPPYSAYAAIFATYGALLAGAGALSRAVGRDPQCNTPLDAFMLSMATFKAARTLARDEVTSFIREPFVEGEADSEDEEPVQTGDIQQAIGELVTCSRCAGTWAAAALATAQVVTPRFGRLVTWCVGAAGINDFLQAGFAALARKANELERRVA